jgi:hypothetical protein
MSTKKTPLRGAFAVNWNASLGKLLCGLNQAWAWTYCL